MNLNVVLFEPRDPGNFANITRTCVAFNAKIHLIRPYGFFYNPKNSTLKRASAGHIDDADITEYIDAEDFFKLNNDPNNIHYMYTRFGKHTPSEVQYDCKHKNIFLWFGREDIGLPDDLLNDFQDTTLRIPTSFKMRSINLANTVAIGLYLVVEQNNFDGLCIKEPHKESPIK